VGRVRRLLTDLGIVLAAALAATAYAYAIRLGAGTQVLTHLPWFLLVGGKPGELPRAVMMGAGWAINVVVAEWIIRNRTARPSTVLATFTERRGLTPAR
jgi:hypothetical protein